MNLPEESNDTEGLKQQTQRKPIHTLSFLPEESNDTEGLKHIVHGLSVQKGASSRGIQRYRRIETYFFFMAWSTAISLPEESNDTEGLKLNVSTGEGKAKLLPEESNDTEGLKRGMALDCVGAIILLPEESNDTEGLKQHINAMQPPYYVPSRGIQRYRRIETPPTKERA